MLGTLLVIAFGLYFLLQALTAFLGLVKTPDPTRTVIVFIYCLVAGLWIIYEAGGFRAVN